MSDMPGLAPREEHSLSAVALEQGPAPVGAGHHDEPTESERVEAVERFLAARGRYPGVSEELRRSRLAEIEADALDGASVSVRRTDPKHSASIEL